MGKWKLMIIKMKSIWTGNSNWREISYGAIFKNKFKKKMMIQMRNKMMSDYIIWDNI